MKQISSLVRSDSISLLHAEKQQQMTSSHQCFRHSPSTIEVTLPQAAVLRQRGWIEPKGWQALTIAVSFITIVTVGGKNARNLSVGGNLTENSLSQSTANFYPGQLVKKTGITKSMPSQKCNLSFHRISINYPRKHSTESILRNANLEVTEMHIQG